VDELERIARLRNLLSTAPAAGVTLGIGDDAALLAPASGSLVLSVDASVEGVHFSQAWAGLDVIAERAFAAALSDLAAMGAQPRAALSSLALPADFPDADFEQLARGSARAAQAHACPIVGGNLVRASELSIHTTVLGEVEPALALRRDGARDGDGVFVTGILGAAALGLAVLQRGTAPSEGARTEPFVARWRQPVPRIAEGLALRSVASAAIDVSDGLVQDLGHVCAASKLGAVIEAGCLPLARGHVELAHALGGDPLAFALAGGEDYELVFTLPPRAAAPAFATRIGRIDKAAHGVMVLDAAGRKLQLDAQGYRHW
jgi:thiamine-monophosphate kinase